MKSYETTMLLSGCINILNLIIHRMGVPNQICWVLLGITAALMMLSFGDFICKECK